MSVKATYYLGIKVGFPLTQTCVLVSALWGVLYFKEIHFDCNIRHCARTGAAMFFFGIVCVLLGAFLIGESAVPTS